MKYSAPDGRVRSAATERRLNDACVSAFASAAGQFVLQYLRQITIESVGGPGIAPDHLMHLEGQRFIVGVIEQRIKLGQQGEPKDENNARRKPDTHR
jgi:hypothetical protein